MGDINLELNAIIILLSILLCSTLSLAFTIERLIYLGRVGSYVQRVRKAVRKEDVEEIELVCQTTRENPVSNVMTAGLYKRESRRELIRETIEDALNAELPKLERFLPALSTIATVTPLLGLLGTIFGMISTFNDIRIHGTGDPNVLAGGISTALVTTAAGLTVAIPTVIVYNYFANKVNLRVSEIETLASEVVDIISEQQDKGNAKSYTRNSPSSTLRYE